MMIYVAINTVYMTYIGIFLFYYRFSKVFFIIIIIIIILRASEIMTLLNSCLS